jgi:microcystin degradation protein MlrC
MARIAVGGMRHETNTFAPVKADLEDYQRDAGYPGLCRGNAMVDALMGKNLSVAGFMAEARACGHEVVPLLWCFATPSAHTTDRAFETISSWLLEHLNTVGKIDALYLDLHGARVTECYEDGDGELLRRARAIVGPRVPIVSALDFHANVSPAMVQLADALVGYRTYPHVDRADTGRRAAKLMDEILRSGEPLHKAFRQLPFLIPLTSQCTLVEPMRDVIETVERNENSTVPSLSFAAGFPLADIRDCGPSVFGYGRTREAADAAVGAVLEAVTVREAAFTGKYWQADDAVREAMRLTERGPGVRRGPVILADTQDNPGAGGNSDTTGLLAALIRGRAENAIVAMMFDPHAAKQAHAAGEGAEIVVALGGKSGVTGDSPFNGRFLVEKLSQGEFDATGPMMAGMRYRLGPMAVLRSGGVRVVVSSVRAQALDRSQISHFGLDPASFRIIALKSSVHFRNDYTDILSSVLIVESPGPNVADLRKLPFRNLRPGVRIGDVRAVRQ